MEYVYEYKSSAPVRAVLLDFDGTISTLRCGWEKVMKPLMLEMISGGKPYGPELEKEVDDYINESTGIQTIHQMKWLAERAVSGGMNPDAPSDPWWYKAEYNRRLMQSVSDRVASLKSGNAPREGFLIKGSEKFLSELAGRGIKLYVASGTDDPDVKKEANALGVDKYFTQIAGAPVDSENCSKEKVIAMLMEAEGLSGDDFAVIGDGKVEIKLAREAGARAIGLASDEEKLAGVNPVKRTRLINAGAHVITGDFTNISEILNFLGLEG